MEFGLVCARLSVMENITIKFYHSESSFHTPIRSVEYDQVMFTEYDQLVCLVAASIKLNSSAVPMMCNEMFARP